MVLREIRHAGHDHVSYFFDRSSGLEAILAIHDTTLGPALGGTRVLAYPSEEDALHDVLRLSQAMTYKAAAANLDLGGGKAVIVGDPATVKTEARLRAYGRAVETLGGTYITTEDMNTEVGDMDVVAEETDYVVGTSDGLGDPSPVTAHGILHGMRTCLEWHEGDSSLDEVDVVVQGAGKVGGTLAARLVEAGASVTIADPNPENRQQVLEAVDGDVSIVDVEAALTEPCQIFAPCATGYLGLNGADSLRQVIPELPCDMIAGAANNALGDRDEARRNATLLADHDILYAPDYVINAGGLILTAHDWRDSTRDAAFKDAEQIRTRLETIFERADEEGVTTLEAADRYAEDRIQAGPADGG